MKNRTTTVKTGSNKVTSAPRMGRPASHIPFGAKGAKFTISQLFRKLENRKSGGLTRVAILNRVQKEKALGHVKEIGAKISGPGRPEKVFQVMKKMPDGRTMRRSRGSSASTQKAATATNRKSHTRSTKSAVATKKAPAGKRKTTVHRTLAKAGK